MPGQFINTGTNPSGKLSLVNNSNAGNLQFRKVYNQLTIATNAGGGLTGFDVGGQAVACSILSNPAIGTIYPVGSLITFQNGEVRTFDGYDDYGEQYDIFYSSPISSLTLFPITISN